MPQSTVFVMVTAQPSYNLVVEAAESALDGIARLVDEEAAKEKPAGHAKTKTVPIIGLDYKDEAAEGLKWLARHGDPYDLSVTDRDGRIGINYGVYGVPETFLIDKAGVIRYKQIGPVTQEALKDKILPLIRELNK